MKYLLSHFILNADVKLLNIFKTSFYIIPLKKMLDKKNDIQEVYMYSNLVKTNLSMHLVTSNRSIGFNINANLVILSHVQKTEGQMIS